jgi:hypothetical protein
LPGAQADSPAGFDASEVDSFPDAARLLDGLADRPTDERPGDGGEDALGADVASFDTLQDAPVDAGIDSGIAPDAAPADADLPTLVTMQFTGKVFTVSKMPLGLDSSAYMKPISGTFAYDLRTTDSSPLDPKRGTYKHRASSVFTFSVLGRNVEGSGRAVVVTENFDPDTFRFNDGPQLDGIPRLMKVDGVTAPSLVLRISMTDESGAMLTSDALPDPFPAISFPKSHTFELTDSGGTLLMQLDSLTKR